MNKGLLITGTYGVGKTTLHQAIKPHTREAYHAEDGARIHIAKSGVRVDAMTPDERAHMQRQTNAYYVGAATVASALDRRLISDGSLIEAYVYSELSLPEECEELVSFLSAYKEKYIACILPPTIPLIDDGLRHLDTDLRVHVHRRIVQVIQEFSIPHVFIVEQSVGERTKELLAHL